MNNLDILEKIFCDEDKNIKLIKEGEYYGGMYNGKKYMYSKKMISLLTSEKLESLIKNQIGFSQNETNI